MLGHLINLLFPITCCGCGQNLVLNEDVLCTDCLYKLPITKYWSIEENKVAKKLWGRARLTHCSSYMHFNKEGVVQRILHQLKYKGNKEIGAKLGKMYGLELLKVKELEDVSLIVPLPLHQKKEKKRGYNQSQMIAEGMAEVFQVEVDATHLIKSQQTSSQTNLNRWNRWMNQQEKFELVAKEYFENKHILMVDDVITTGATMEACVSLLNEVPNCKVSAVFLASAL